MAKKINGEIISADSMQIYKDMNIGTAKPDKQEQAGIPHHLLDVLSPEQRYSVANFKQDAKQAIKQIIQKGNVPIIVGGTGLYIDSLIYEIEYDDIQIDEKYREELEKRAQTEGLDKLYEEAKKIDPEAMKMISINDQKRIFRVLEIYQKTGKTKTKLEQESRQKQVEYDYMVYAIDMDRELLYNRINKRVDIMMENGLIQEVQAVLEKYKTFPTAMQGIGYKEVAPYLNGNITKDEMIENLKMQTRRYAKRQLTWFRKNEDIIWLDGKQDIQNNVEIILEGFLSGSKKEQ